MYDLLSCSAEDRAAGEYHSAPVLHVPSNIIYLINNVICLYCACHGHFCNSVCDTVGSPISAMHVTDCSQLPDPQGCSAAMMWLPVMTAAVNLWVCLCLAVCG